MDIPPDVIFISRDKRSHKWTAQPYFQGIRFVSADIAEELARELEAMLATYVPDKYAKANEVLRKFKELG